MEDRDTGAQTLASLFRDQRRRIGAVKRGDGLPAAPDAGTTFTVDAAQPGFAFATAAAGTWTRWTDGVGRPEGEGLPGTAG